MPHYNFGSWEFILKSLINLNNDGCDNDGDMYDDNDEDYNNLCLRSIHLSQHPM